MTDRRPALLVVVLDADLRAQVFEQLRTAGFQVDAVADLHSGRRRLDRDDYPLVIFERGMGELPIQDEQVLLMVDPSVEGEVDTLLGRVEEALSGDGS